MRALANAVLRRGGSRPLGTCATANRLLGDGTQKLAARSIGCLRSSIAVGRRLPVRALFAFALVVGAPGQLLAASSDLIPQNITVSSTTLAPGATFTASWTLANIGAGAANAASTTMVRITQSPSSAVGTNLVSVATPALAGGSFVSQSTPLSAPTTPGTYYVWVIADNYSAITNQSNTTNDLQHSSAFTVQAASSDLIPQDISTSSTTLAPGASFTASWTLANVGTGGANATSTTVVRITQLPSSAAGTNLAAIATPALSAGGSVGQSAPLSAPTTPGTYYVWVIADNYSTVTNQSNVENDKQRSQPISVTSGRSYVDDYPYASENFNSADPWLFYYRECTSFVAWRMNRDGRTTSPPFFFSNYMRGGHWGNAENWDDNAIALGFRVDQVPARGAIAHWNSTELANPSFPGHVAYVEAVNADGSVDVSEYNFRLAHAFGYRLNVTAPRYIHVQDGPQGPADLVPQNVSISQTVLTPGASFSASWILANAGQVAANATSTTAVRINQSPTSATGANLAGIATPALAAGASVSQSAPLVAPTTPSTYYVWVIANSGGTVTNQSNTANDQQRSPAITVQGASSSAARRDFDGDVRSDVLWRHDGGTLVMWLMNGLQIKVAGSQGTVQTAWKVVGLGDYDGDGKGDVLWRHDGGTVVMWLMNGTQIKAAGGQGTVPVDWKVAGVGDFDGDGKADVLWRHDGGTVAMWLMNGTQVKAGGGLGIVPVDWTVVAVGDFDGDRKSDVMWRRNSGTVMTWLMNGTQMRAAGSPGSVPSVWKVAGTGDLDGDGRSDVLWRHDGGTVVMWLLNGTQIKAAGSQGVVPTAWQVVGLGDFDGDARTDVLWRNDGGTVVMWLMNGTQIKASGGQGIVPTAWRFQENATP